MVADLPLAVSEPTMPVCSNGCSTAASARIDSHSRAVSRTPTIVVTHSEEKLPPPVMKDWERRGAEQKNV